MGKASSPEQAEERSEVGSGPGVCLLSDIQDDTSGAGEAALSNGWEAVQPGEG